jgi:hypothetical protein
MPNGIGKSTASVKVLGVTELRRALSKLPRQAQVRVLKRAVNAATSNVRRAIVRHIPLGDGLRPNGMPRPHLRQGFVARKARLFKESVTAVLGPTAAVPHSHLVDRGTRPHYIKLGKRWGRVPAGSVILHSGATPVRFIKRGVRDSRNTVEEKMLNMASKGIESEMRKLLKKT